jgi:hypothetical protein
MSAVVLGLALLGCTSNTAVTKDTGAGSCLAADEVCDADADECCNGSICASKRGSGLPATCHANCLSNAQCASGCCVALSTGESAICVEASACAAPACGQGGADCSTNVDSCCANAVCVTTTTDPGTCADTCRAHAECKSGCCAPLTNSKALVCSPPSFCR